tara:strand:- start:961 stop:1290 length:330 start_codon:yes stop_codon:yes gene_type:complete
MTVIAYLKEQCGWSRGVREVLAKCGIDYEERQIHIPENYMEMVEKTGQPLQPCVQFDDVMLVDVSGEEVLDYLVSSGHESMVNTNVPLDAPCTDEEHEQMRTQFYDIQS